MKASLIYFLFSKDHLKLKLLIVCRLTAKFKILFSLKNLTKLFVCSSPDLGFKGLLITFVDSLDPDQN